MKMHLHTLIIWLTLLSPAMSEIIIYVGHDHTLQANSAGQEVRILVEGGDLVTGFNLRAQLGDGVGGATEPVFESIVFSGGVWDAFAFTPASGNAPPVDGAEQVAQTSVVFNNSGDQVAASGLIATLVIDTTGFGAGTSFPLMLRNTQIGQDSDFIVTGGGTQAATIFNGSINLIPEPATVVQLLILAVLGFGFVVASRTAAPKII
jgi:hypothetical protein